MIKKDVFVIATQSERRYTRRPDAGIILVGRSKLGTEDDDAIPCRAVHLADKYIAEIERPSGSYFNHCPGWAPAHGPLDQYISEAELRTFENVPPEWLS